MWRSAWTIFSVNMTVKQRKDRIFFKNLIFKNAAPALEYNEGKCLVPYSFFIMMLVSSCASPAPVKGGGALRFLRITVTGNFSTIGDR